MIGWKVSYSSAVVSQTLLVGTLSSQGLEKRSWGIASASSWNTITVRLRDILGARRLRKWSSGRGGGLICSKMSEGGVEDVSLVKRSTALQELALGLEQSSTLGRSECLSST